MRREASKRLLAIVLTIALHGYAGTDAVVLNSASVYVNKGDVRVDGLRVPGSMAIAGGDEVKSGNDSSASVRVGTTSIQLAPNTNIEWVDATELTLNDGDIIVDTWNDVRTDLGPCGSVVPTLNQTSVPAPAPTRYEVQIQGNRAYVYARELPVTIQTQKRLLHMQPAEVALIENIRATECKIVYYPKVEDAIANGILIGSYTAAPIVLLNLPDNPPMSGVCPADRCPQ